MRHQSARVVFAACLTAAFAAAQAPSFRNFDASDLGAGGFGSSASRAAADERRAHESWPRERWSLARFQDPMDPGPDYSMTGMFRQAHQEFLAGKSRYEPMASLGLALFPNARVNGESGSFDIVIPTFDVDIPIVLSPEGYLLLGGYYEMRHYVFTSSTTLADETLHAAGIKLGFGAFLDSETFLEVEFAPGVFSDADAGLHHEDYDFPSHALVTYRVTPDLFWKLGLRYNQIYADAPVLPYIGVSWDITGMMTPEGSDYASGDNWRLDVLLPEYIELSYWPTGSTGFSFGADIAGAEYHVRTSRAAGRQRDDLRVQELITYLGFVHRFTDYMSFSIKSGVTLAGDYELTNGAAGFQKVDGALDQTYFVRATFGIDW